MEGDVVRRHPVNPSLSLSQEPEGPERALPDPLREGRPPDQPQEFPDMPVRRMCVRGVVGVMVMPVLVSVRHRHRRSFRRAVTQSDRDLRGRDPRPIHPGQLHRHLGAAKAGGQRSDPVLAGAEVDQRPQQHVATDARRRVDDRKTAVRHRLGNIAP